MGMVKSMRCDLCCGLWNGEAPFDYWLVFQCIDGELWASRFDVLAIAFPE
ncbi:hypothetical protein HMPREF0864_04697 [Enterobacteriaceae bacterium 9_2_54FAA]|jgi:hypothetical protein|nr:hypothetical protein HMPREF0864_04697 [Enterobacteriaceae bacterium 9_2_54FAA]